MNAIPSIMTIFAIILFNLLIMGIGIIATFKWIGILMMLLLLPILFVKMSKDNEIEAKS